MKVTREQATENRIRVLDAASRLFRERGVDHVTVADVMADAGLTHGGFYASFASKSDLVVQATARALGEQADQWRAVIETAEEDAFQALVRFYVSSLHRDTPGAGCALGALAADAARGDAAMQATFADGLSGYVDLLASIAPGRTKALRRQHALAAISAMIGALVLARATDNAPISDEILKSTANQLVSNGEQAISITK